MPEPESAPKPKVASAAKPKPAPVQAAPKPTLVAPQAAALPRCTKPWPSPQFELEMPEAAAFGWGKHKAIELEGPLGWGYVSLLCMHAGQGLDMDYEPRIRPTLYAVLMAKPEIGKSVMMNRAKDALRISSSSLYRSTPNSAQAIASDYPMYSDKAQETNNPLTAALLYSDEFGELCQAFAFSSSQLPMTLCSLFYDDTHATSKSGTQSWAQVRLSILGALPVADVDEFREVFTVQTMKGLYSRFVLVPGPETWQWDHRMEVVGEYRTPHAVAIPDKPYSLYQAWVNAKPGRGRIAEIGLRVAKISASLNGDSEVSMECMKAAMHFCEWQEKVRAEYTPSQASEKATDSIVTEKILKAVEKEGRDKDGNRRLVKWSFLSRKYHFDRLGAALVKRVREAMMADGVIEGDMHQEYDKFENPVGKPVWTGMVQPAAGEGE